MFSIILLLYDPFDAFVTAGVMPRAIEGVLSLQGSYELIIVDNNNASSSRKHLRSYLLALESRGDPRLKLVVPGENLGTARGFNAGMKVSDPSSKYLVFMSADGEVVDPLMLTKIAAVLENAPEIAIAHPMSVFEDSNEYNVSSDFAASKFLKAVKNRSSQYALELTDAEMARLVSAIPSSPSVRKPMRSFPLTFAVLRRSAIAAIGSFDNDIPLVCGENDDLAYRVLLGGYSVARLNSVFVNHRRYLFHHLTHDADERSTRVHSQGQKQLKTLWNKKWGRPYVELYVKWRYGRIIFGLLLPVFWARRFMWYLRDRSLQNA